MPAILGQPLQARAPIKVTRGADDTGNTSVINLLVIVLAVIVGLGLVLLGILLVLKRVRRQRTQAASPPRYNDVIHENKNHHHLTIETKDGRSSVILYNKDGRPMLANPNSPPHSPDNVPEIHITFPDEEDSASGKRKSGRVVVVRVGDNAAVGLEPLDEDQLPAYEKNNNSHFYSIDMDDIGGLREKEREDYH
ncbi:hypothetical protein M406DRAFT_349263 [Cryphonectria parasitica EP155]|uniref:Uncharacterized protein n=1 Tax=Cryphonectria parasitica (strain ATCC 38755 / EP155) TaxID=660469 RepID=A0A9P5CTM8_CRYP1|nr:uncharacterized protein M406DRAFT_349263 [Cryphonectria parasitica EP155]KAF3770508.1 hypothetical protein M406DRAFT_349263 [Cryphonectria parasitica EP155]